MSNSHPQVVLVTGASSGIGRAVAQHLHAQGYRVFGTQYQTRIIESTITMIPMNVDDDESVRQGMVRLYEEAGRLDAVVNSAGWLLIGSIEDTSLAEAKAQFETNFFGILRVSKAALPFLRGQGSGHIVNISSLGGVQGLPYCGLYCASKFAIEGLSESLRLEVSRFGVHVVIIEAGDFHTRMSTRRRMVAEANENSIYSQSYTRLMERAAYEESQAPTPEPIAYLVDRILCDPAPKLRYRVGLRSQTAIVPLKRYLPQSLFERLLYRMMPQ
jgi:NAD(P)-dependent dehydrogenase (short-subunit alcohol dehydrogenase family)